jgi:hypothetical protein
MSDATKQQEPPKKEAIVEQLQQMARQSRPLSDGEWEKFLALVQSLDLAR